MKNKIFENKGVQYEVITRTEKGKEKSFVVVDGCEVPTSKNGLTKEFMKKFVLKKDRTVRLWYLNLCHRLTKPEISEALNKECNSLEIERVREEFIKKFDLEFIYNKSTYKTYLKELEAELFKGEELTEEEREMLCA